MLQNEIVIIIDVIIVPLLSVLFQQFLWSRHEFESLLLEPEFFPYSCMLFGNNGSSCLSLGAWTRRSSRPVPPALPRRSAPGRRSHWIRSQTRDTRTTYLGWRVDICWTAEIDQKKAQHWLAGVIGIPTTYHKGEWNSLKKIYFNVKKWAYPKNTVDKKKILSLNIKSNLCTLSLCQAANTIKPELFVCKKFGRFCKWSNFRSIS